MRRSILSLAAALAVPAVVSAAPLFTDDFDADHTANWNVYKAGANDTGQDALFTYDYSALGIPSAPHSTGGSTVGLRFRSDFQGTATTLGAISASPIGQSFTSPYTVSVDLWANYIGGTSIASGGSNSTECFNFGVGTAGTAPQSPLSADSLMFAGVHDGGASNASNSDYRVYLKTARQDANTTPYYSAGQSTSAASNVNAFYNFLPSTSAPSFQQTTYAATQTGLTPVGVVGFAWHNLQISNDGTNVGWFIDGTLVAKVPLSAITLGGSNIFLGMFDTNATSSSGNGTFLNFDLYDNLSVVDTALPIPEPASLSLLAGMGLFLRRRR